MISVVRQSQGCPEGHLWKMAESISRVWGEVPLPFYIFAQMMFSAFVDAPDVALRVNNF